jgi:uncharacterized protein YdeI (BOF family)
VCLATALFAAGNAASTGAIAVAKAQGEFRVDHAAVAGNGTVFEGSLVETGTVRSDILLRGGGTVALEPASAGKVTSSGLVLTAGTAEVNRPGYVLQVNTLRITPDGSAAGRVQVRRIDGATARLRVATEGAAATVRNAQGLLVARVMPGAAMEFREDASSTPSQQFQGSGVVQKQGNRYFLVDRTTNVKVELSGKGLDKFTGRTVEIQGVLASGAAAAAAEIPIVRISSLTVIVGGPAGGVIPAAPAGVVHAGFSTTTVAIIGGVAAASAVGGLYGAGIIGASEAPVSK